jgi:hypothetical protein
MESALDRLHTRRSWDMCEVVVVLWVLVFSLVDCKTLQLEGTVST